MTTTTTSMDRAEERGRRLRLTPGCSDIAALLRLPLTDAEIGAPFPLSAALRQYARDEHINTAAVFEAALWELLVYADQQDAIDGRA